MFSSVFSLYCSPVPLEVFFLSILFVRLLPCLTSIDDFLLSVGKSKESFHRLHVLYFKEDGMCEL